MKETYEYNIEDENNENFNIKCKAEYDTTNSYNTNYYFYDGNKWLKDFIDLNKLSPDNEEESKAFEDFITRVHDYMVHGNLWEDLKELDDNKIENKKTYNLVIKAKKIWGV